jgi:hypothetical protein
LIILAHDLNNLKTLIFTTMKKVLFAVAFVAFATVSCKKDYVCECTVMGQTIDNPIENASKSDAEEACDALNAAAAVGGGSCKLK